ncbi:hypothetical protein DFH08DRAFT_819297 [Mycena albidolilacea]|uniref:Uncharacterized protein n=1 Tax=Mycena albidolilacea TaxID=1033008 RepID=A0AAD7EGS6_9AGAR|nr:hypothetical protein DFH08DRAFT_819297 [Mycena albidolilacea]
MPKGPQGGMASKIRPEYMQFSVDRQHLVRALCKALHCVKVAGLEQLANEVLTRSQDAREVGDEVVDVYKEIVPQAHQRRLCATHQRMTFALDCKTAEMAEARIPGDPLFQPFFPAQTSSQCPACGYSNWGMHLSETTRLPGGS